MSQAAPFFVVMGRIGAPYGVGGWQHIESYTKPIENIFQYHEWGIKQKGRWVPFELAAQKAHGQGFVIKLQGIDSREKAALLTNSEIGVPREKLAVLREDEFYWADLENLMVETTKGDLLGRVQYLYDNAGSDILVVKGSQGSHKEQHIPFLLHETIVKVDMTLKKIIVDWEFF